MYPSVTQIHDERDVFVTRAYARLGGGGVALLLLATACKPSQPISPGPVQAPSSAPPPAYMPPVMPAYAPDPTPSEEPTRVPAPPPFSSETEDLVSSAVRKMHHHDGKGCIEDLDQLKDRNPSATMLLRTQCRMLLGHCQEGKKTLARHYVEQTNMSQARAEKTAESVATLYCRDGDSTPRDRLLRAYQELSNGAYLDPRKDCEQNVQKLRTLAPKVPPRDSEDSVVVHLDRVLYHMGASCHAQAGDCKAAWRTYRDLYPKELLKSRQPEQRDKLLRDQFTSMIRKCEDSAP